MVDSLTSRHRMDSSFSTAGGAATPASVSTAQVRTAVPCTPPRVPSSPGARSSRGKGNSASPSPKCRTALDDDLGAVIEGLRNEYEELNSRYDSLLSASQLGGPPDSTVQSALQELSNIMARKVCVCVCICPLAHFLFVLLQREQLSRLQRSQRTYRTRVSRSPVRSPGAALQRSEAIRTMASLKRMNAHPLE